MLERGSWKAKLSDFGSKRLADLAVTERPECFPYAAPEMFPPAQTTKTDSFSFGILLCELMMEEKPGEKMQQVGAFGKKWPHFRSIVTACVEDNPAKRPSMDGIIKELDKISLK